MSCANIESAESIRTDNRCCARCKYWLTQIGNTPLLFQLAGQMAWVERTVKSEKGNSDQPGWPLKSTRYRNESLELVHHLSFIPFVTTLLFPFPFHFFAICSTSCDLNDTLRPIRYGCVLLKVKTLRSKRLGSVESTLSR